MFLLMWTPPDYDYLSQRAGITDAAGLRAALLKKLEEVNLMNKKRDLEHLLFLRESAEKILSFGTFIGTTLRQMGIKREENAIGCVFSYKRHNILI